MRHATRSQRLSRPNDQRLAILNGLVKGLIVHGHVKTTFTRAKEAQRVADRLVTWGKDGSIHARRQAFRILQDRTLVKQLFADIAPGFLDIPGGYTRVTRLGYRRGDGAQEALLTLSRISPTVPSKPAPARAADVHTPPAADAPAAAPAEETGDKGKGFLEGLRGLWTRKKQL